MAYELVYTKRAVKDIRRLDHKVKERLKKVLEKFKEAPFEESVKKLSHPELGTYRLRIGDYRVIFDVDGDNLIILRLGHRKDIYRGI